MSFDQNGTFTIRDVTPGDYRLFVRPGGGPPPPPGSQAQGVPKPEYAVVPISVSSDIEDLVVVTKPGVSVIGEVVFAEGPPATLPSGLRIVGTPAERTMMMGPQPSGVVGANLQFTLNDAFGPLFVRVAAGLPRGYAVKEVRLGSTDISDTPVEFKAEDSKRLQVVLTSRVATLEGTVTDDDGAPVDDALVLIIPEEKSSWRMGSPRLRTLSGFKEGKYSSPAVLPGRYFVVAVPRERFSPGIDPRPDYFEPFTRDATAVVLNDGETRTVDLRVARPADR
jgi:hypothetical protein